MTRLCLVLSLLLACLVANPTFAQGYKLGSLEIVQPWARATPPSAPAGGGFLTITNTGSAPDRLVSAKSPAAELVQIHETKLERNVITLPEVEKGPESPAPGSVSPRPRP